MKKPLIVKKIFQNAYEALSQADYKGSLKELEKVKSEASTEHSLMIEKSFLKSKNLILQGDYKQALGVIEKNLNNYRPQVQIICEQANLFLLTSDLVSWRKAWKQTDSYLEKNYFLLSPKEIFRTQVNLNKFLEIDGHIYEALEKYKEFFEKNKHQETEEVYLCLSQILRLEAIYGTPSKTKNYYLKLSEYSGDNGSYSLFVEIQHALFLAELRLNKQNIAEARLFNIIKDNKIKNPEDRNLFLTEFIEFSLIHQKTIDASTIKSILDKKHLTPYEKIIFNFFENSDFFIPLHEMIQLKQKLPLSEVLSISALSLKRTKNEESFLEFINFLLYSFSAKTRDLWKKRLDLCGQKSNLILKFHINSGEISCKDQRITLKNNEVIKEIFQIFSQNDSASTAEVLNKIYNEPFCSASFEKLRTLFKRFNKTIYKLSLEEEFAFKVQKLKILKNDKIKLVIT